MENVFRRFLVPTLAILVLGFGCPPTNAARRVGGSAYDGTWSVAIYTLRGDCSSVRDPSDRRWCWPIRIGLG
jgi:hypothetical protein